MNVLAQSAFLSALGWALLHSLWQMGVLWLLYVVITANGRRFLARQRYNIALGLTAIGSLLFLLTILVQFSYGTQASLFALFTYNSTPLSASGGFFSLLTSALPLLSGIYLAVILLLFIRFFRQYYYTSRLLNTGLTKAPAEIRLFLQQAAAQLGVHKKIRIGYSDLITTPLTMGFWKPVILLPIAIASHLSIKQTEAIILHELNHIRKNDYLVNLLLVCLDIILFFNPFSRLLSAALLKERENSCDDMVLQFQYKPGDYARALLILEQYRLQAVPVLAISATGSGKRHLLNRINRILNGKTPQSLPGFRMLAFMFIAFIIGMTGFLSPLSIRKVVDIAITEPVPGNRSLEITPVFNTSSPSKPDEKSQIRFTADKKAARPASAIEPAEATEAVTLARLEKEATISEAEAKYLEELANYEKNVIGYATVYNVNTQPDRDYSISESGSISAAPVEVSGFQAVVPYIPSSSFSYIYQLNSDTAFPKKYPVSDTEVKARMELEKAIATLENLDLGKLEKELGASALQLKKLELQLKKTLQSDDWHKMSRDLQSNYKAVENQLRLKQAYLAEVGKLNAQTRQQAVQTEKQQKIVMDRIMENQQLQKCVEEKQKSEVKKVKVRKTVVI